MGDSIEWINMQDELIENISELEYPNFHIMLAHSAIYFDNGN